MSRQARQWLIVLGTLLGVWLGGASLRAQEILRLTRNIPGDSKPIVLQATGAATWNEGGQRMILLSGKVLIEHGLLSIRCNEAVVWVDEDSYRRTRIMKAQVYAEGAVAIENGSENKRAGQAMVELSTRGELKIKVQGKIVQSPQVDDALYLRALAVKSSALQTGPGLERTGFEDKRAAPSGPPPVPPVPGIPGPFEGTQGADAPRAGAQGADAPRSEADAPRSVPVPAPKPAPGGPTPTDSISNQPIRPIGPLPGSAPTPPVGVPLPPRPGETPGADLLVPRAPLNAPPRIVTIAPRTSQPFNWQSFTMPNGEKAVVVTGGIQLLIRAVQGFEIVDIEADRLVFWSRGDTEGLFSNMRSSQGQATRELEFYLAGNVEIRQQSRPTDSRVLRADEVYYDVSRNVAVAVSADLAIRRPGVPEPIHLRADELMQLSPTLYEAVRAEVFASKLPSDPGLRVVMAQATLEEQTRPRQSIFGRQVVSRETGQARAQPEHFFRGTEVVFQVEDVPILWLPFLQGRVERPFGPLIDARLGGNRIYGFEFGLTFDMYDLLGLDPVEGTRWRLDVDYLSRRGPGLGTRYDYSGRDLFGIPSVYTGLIHAWGLYDDGNDILGGIRDNEPHPYWRGRVLMRHHWWGLPDGFTLWAQLSALSDKNFLEQYFKTEFDSGLNQETFVYVKQQQEWWAWTGLVEPRIRHWVTETEWLPRLDGWLLGLSLADLFTYHVHAHVGYAQLEPTQEPPPPVQPTQVRTETGRSGIWQELAMPFYVGPVKLMPYGRLDLTEYTEDLTGSDRGRFYGAGGAMASIPFSRLYPAATSELFNVNGIFHKIVLSANYYVAHSDTVFTRLPQLDPVDDDATDQARRDITPTQILYNPGHAAALASPLFNPQRFAIRRLVEDRIDTLDTIQVLQFDIRQRWQTKRGYPGRQHVVDWMVLDTSASYFPNPARDNFNRTFAFIEYDWLWNIGDRTALTATGWIDPHTDGARVFTIGTFFNRPDRTTLFLGYRHIEPLQSDAVTGSVSYVLSPKYAVTGATVYDFGTSQALSNSLVFTRMGADLQISVGVTYNVMQNNFGATFMIVPNLLPSARNGAPGAGGINLAGR